MWNNVGNGLMKLAGAIVGQNGNGKPSRGNAATSPVPQNRAGEKPQFALSPEHVNQMAGFPADYRPPRRPVDAVTSQMAGFPPEGAIVPPNRASTNRAVYLGTPVVPAKPAAAAPKRQAAAKPAATKAAAAKPASAPAAVPAKPAPRTRAKSAPVAEEVQPELSLTPPAPKTRSRSKSAPVMAAATEVATPIAPGGDGWTENNGVHEYRTPEGVVHRIRTENRPDYTGRSRTGFVFKHASGDELRFSNLETAKKHALKGD